MFGKKKEKLNVYIMRTGKTKNLKPEMFMKRFGGCYEDSY